MGACPPPPSSLARLLAPVVLAQWLRAFFERIPLVCGQPFLTSTWLSIQTNSDQSRDYLGHGQLQNISSPISNLSGTVPDVTTVPARIYHQLCVSYCVFTPLPSNFNHPGLSWHTCVNSPHWEWMELKSHIH